MIAHRNGEQAIRRCLSEEEFDQSCYVIQESYRVAGPEESLPFGLGLRRGSDGKCRVFAERRFEKGARFGPAKGRRVYDIITYRYNQSSRYPIVKKSDGRLRWFLDTSEMSNWMRHVTSRVISNNLVACQVNHEIYFYSIETIQPGTELVFWYHEDLWRRIQYFCKESWKMAEMAGFRNIDPEDGLMSSPALPTPPFTHFSSTILPPLPPAATSHFSSLSHALHPPHFPPSPSLAFLSSYSSPISPALSSPHVPPISTALFSPHFNFPPISPALSSSHFPLISLDLPSPHSPFPIPPSSFSPHFPPHTSFAFPSSFVPPIPVFPSPHFSSISPALPSPHLPATSPLSPTVHRDQFHQSNTPEVTASTSRDTMASSSLLRRLSRSRRNRSKKSKTRISPINPRRGHRALPYQLRRANGKFIYHCKECSKVFSQISNLTAHRLTHTGERPFMCGICRKRFKQKAHLGKHKNVHRDR